MQQENSFRKYAVSDLIKHMAARLPGPLRTAKHIKRTGLDVFFPFYHAVSNQDLPHTKHLYSLRNTAQFQADLDYLLNYFEPVKMGEFLAGEGRRDAQKPSMVLSFDDGLIQCHREVMPILLRKGIPATFFLNNDFIDNRDLFFRYKVSLLLELLPEKSEAEKKQAARILQCPVSEIGRWLLDLSYLERELPDRIAERWNYSFRDYLSANQVYLSSRHIQEMIQMGFEFGSHGFDHPMFSMLPIKESLDHIRQSTEDLQVRFGLDYKYFSFPFTDYGVQDNTIEELFRRGIIDAGFGTAGLKEDSWPGYYQRVPMEWAGLDARKVLRGELNRRRARLMLGNNRVSRGDTNKQQ
jgi:peptidoglycan/xylan/chitin deacetylase (PgdA/CDA1 family)